jgi:hypothetical protein
MKNVGTLPPHNIVPPHGINIIENPIDHILYDAIYIYNWFQL